MQTCMLLVDLDAFSNEEANQEPGQEAYSEKKHVPQSLTNFITWDFHGAIP